MKALRRRAAAVAPSLVSVNPTYGAGLGRWPPQEPGAAVTGARPALRTAAWRTSSTWNASSRCSSTGYAPHPRSRLRQRRPYRLPEDIAAAATISCACQLRGRGLEFRCAARLVFLTAHQPVGPRAPLYWWYGSGLRSPQYVVRTVWYCAKRAPATMNDEGLADAAAANPFRLPGLHPEIGFRTWRPRQRRRANYRPPGDS
jgi:hypothetical protein